MRAAPPLPCCRRRSRSSIRPGRAAGCTVLAVLRSSAPHSSACVVRLRLRLRLSPMLHCLRRDTRRSRPPRPGRTAAPQPPIEHRALPSTAAQAECVAQPRAWAVGPGRPGQSEPRHRAALSRRAAVQIHPCVRALRQGLLHALVTLEDLRAAGRELSKVTRSAR